jgi:hypothetical protein
MGNKGSSAVDGGDGDDDDDDDDDDGDANSVRMVSSAACCDASRDVAAMVCVEVRSARR